MQSAHENISGTARYLAGSRQQRVKEVNMTTKENKEHRRPMNVYVRRGSKAEKTFRKRSGSPIPKAIVPGIAPSPDHDLKYQGGKTIQHLRFMNFYVGGDAWNPNDIARSEERR